MVQFRKGPVIEQDDPHVKFPIQANVSANSFIYLK